MAAKQDTTSLRLLLSNKMARGYFLNIAAEAEDCDVGQVFPAILELVHDETLRSMIRRHHDDEKHHAELLRECVLRNGVKPSPVPPERQFFIQLTKAVGGFLGDLANTEHAVMKAYLLVQVGEEESSRQFSFIEPILREFDPESADVLALIAKDEVRHIHYCERISAHYAPSEKVLNDTLLIFRNIERQVFAAFKRSAMGA